MRWGIPRERMTEQEQLDELLARATDDWDQPADVFDVARFSASRQDVVLEQAINLTASCSAKVSSSRRSRATAGYQPWGLGP